MSSGCISSARCVDARTPVRATYVNLYKWPESDAEFANSVGKGGGGVGRRKWTGQSPAVVDSYSCRQMYLKSYTFSRKESVHEKTRRCLSKVKERAAELSLFHQRTESSGGGVGGDDHKKKRRKRKTKKKGCASTTARKLKEVSCSALYTVFHRLLSCTTSVEVV